MKKRDLKNLMVVCNGIEEMFVVIKGEADEWILLRDLDESEQDKNNCEEDGLRAFESIDFNDDLVCVCDKPLSIIQVYDSLSIELPFELSVKELFEKHKPKLLWEREPSILSMSKIRSFNTNEAKLEYINSFVPPYFLVED